MSVSTVPFKSTTHVFALALGVATGAMVGQSFDGLRSEKEKESRKKGRKNNFSAGRRKDREITGRTWSIQCEYIVAT